MSGTAAADSRSALVAILQLAYSGERAAGYAYRGHGRSVSDLEERARIRRIEDEEWHHRELVGGMLRDLGSGPSRSREIRAWLIGPTLGLLCHVSGWFAPMYGAAVSKATTSASTRRQQGSPVDAAAKTSSTACS